MLSDIKWPSNWKHIGELWPEFDPTDAETALFEGRLSKLNQTWLRDVLDLHRAEDRQARRKPQIDMLIERYKRISNAGVPVAESGASKVVGWRVTWLTDYDAQGNGKSFPVRVCGKDMYATREAAEAVAARTIEGAVLEVKT